MVEERDKLPGGARRPPGDAGEVRKVLREEAHFYLALSAYVISLIPAALCIGKLRNPPHLHRTDSHAIHPVSSPFRIGYEETITDDTKRRHR
ncbi:methyltransferase 4, putative [Babesia ovata]|uniref:Methyltransferase 4, putative n=1 Tax=Babesia ovata TaxID=189622 RepID=A0A2H6KAZ4_9APIC|nr:methyltransferase 4, putative [Babesia ovata]GBE60155.1 methyltransferase 4, putative [Babesia ovata]